MVAQDGFGDAAQVCRRPQIAPVLLLGFIQPRPVAINFPAIHRAADASDNSDAYVSRVLADMGLMAPRLAFPGDFLDHVDATMCRQRPLRSLPAAYAALAHHWKALGEDIYAGETGTVAGAPLYSFIAV